MLIAGSPSPTVQAAAATTAAATAASKAAAATAAAAEETVKKQLTLQQGAYMSRDSSDNYLGAFKLCQF